MDPLPHRCAIREHQQHHLFELQPVAGLHGLAIEAHAIDLAGEELRFGHGDFGEAGLLQCLFLAGGCGADGRRRGRKACQAWSRSRRPFQCWCGEMADRAPHQH